MSFINFSGSYQPPGVYVTQQTPQVIAVPVTAPSTVALVGPTLGYFTNTDVVTLSTTSTTTLSKKGINLSTVVVTDAYNNVYAASGNYTLAQTGTGTATVTTIEEITASPIGANAVYVSYQYTDANYYLPYQFSSYTAIQATYGNPFDANNNLLSPISLAAQLLYANGSPTVVVMPTTDTGLVATQTGLSTAYVALAARNDIDIVIPLPVGITNATGANSITGVGTDLKSHCDSMAQQSLWRIGILGYESSVTTSTLNPGTLPSTGLAPAIADARVTVAYPNQLSYYYTPNNTTLTVSGYYLAAALAGVLSGNPVQQGLTRQIINGFSGIPAAMLATFTKANKNSWSAAGVSVVEPTSTAQGSSLVCRQGVTTQVNSTVLREISLVRAADNMMFNIYDSLLNSNLIGSPTTTNTPAQIQGLVQGVLDNLVASGVIVGYSSLNTAVTSNNPTVVSVTFAYSPSYPLNYIAVSFSVDTSTGNVIPV